MNEEFQIEETGVDLKSNDTVGRMIEFGCYFVGVSLFAYWCFSVEIAPTIYEFIIDELNQAHSQDISLRVAIYALFGSLLIVILFWLGIHFFKPLKTYKEKGMLNSSFSWASWFLISATVGGIMFYIFGSTLSNMIFYLLYLLLFCLVMAISFGIYQEFKPFR